MCVLRTSRVYIPALAALSLRSPIDIFAACLTAFCCLVSFYNFLCHRPFFTCLFSPVVYAYYSRSVTFSEQTGLIHRTPRRELSRDQGLHQEANTRVWRFKVPGWWTGDSEPTNDRGNNVQAAYTVSFGAKTDSSAPAPLPCPISSAGCSRRVWSFLPTRMRIYLTASS